MKRWLANTTTYSPRLLFRRSAVRLGRCAEDFGCSNATLKGEYAFGVTAYTPPGLPDGPPSVVAGIKVFDGHGGLTQRDYDSDALRTRGQTDFAPKGQETGTYNVNPDCTGSVEIHLNVPNTPAPHGVIEIRFVISDGGRHIREVVAEFTPPGFTTPQPTQTSADDWKVSSGGLSDCSFVRHIRMVIKF